MISNIIALVVGLSNVVSAIEVTRQDEPRAKDETSDWILGQAYASLKENRLARAVHTGRGDVVRYSEDNGLSWSGDQLVSAIEEAGKGRRKLPDFDAFYLDPDNGLFVRFFTEYFERSEGEAGKSAVEPVGPHTRRMYYQVSRDAGRSWGPKLQFMEAGKEFNAEHYARDVWFGKNELVLEGRRILKLRDGTLLAPCYLWPTAEQRRRLYQESGAPPGWPDTEWYYLTVSLRGRWRSDLSGIDWESGGRLLVPSGYTPAGSFGSVEPTVAALDDGRLFCVVRTSSGVLIAEFIKRKMAVLRYCATSDDGGQSWKNVRPLSFSDGGTLYSPSAYSEFIRSSKNGKWYWIGNILSQPTYTQCDPRYPLQIAELDQKTLGIKRETVTVIQDRPAEEPPLVRYSNFRVYEERNSNDFILLLTQGYSELEKNPLKTPTYRYRIKVP